MVVLPWGPSGIEQFSDKGAQVWGGVGIVRGLSVCLDQAYAITVVESLSTNVGVYLIRPDFILDIDIQGGRHD